MSLVNKCYLQPKRELGRFHVLVRPSMTVKGMERAIKRSDMARLKMKMFLAVLISFLLRTAIMTALLPHTAMMTSTV